MQSLHCPVCNAITSVVSWDEEPVPEGIGHAGAHCVLHHPDPAKRAPKIDLPVRMKVQIAKEGE